MNKYLLKSAHVLLPGSQYHDQVVDVLIIDGKISKIGKKIDEETSSDMEVIQAKGQFLSIGFMDLNANFGEPGFENKEDVLTGSQAAFAAGFTAVAVQPNTTPPLHRHAEINLVKNRAKGLPVDVYPVGTISKQREGKEMAEMYDMQLAGAIAFSDGNKSVADSGLMGRALLYSKGINALIISYAEDRQVSDGAVMNEGVMSTYLGMKGNPNLAESLMVARDLYLAEYFEAPIHFTTISTAESLSLIKKAKAKGLAVTCDVAAHHLVLTDEKVKDFDSNYKVNPPLRTKSDVKALVKGVKDGTVDAVVSQHTPHEVEFKRVEFYIAKNGIIGLQTVLPLALKAGLDPLLIVDKLSVGPRKVLGLSIPDIAEGEEANLVLFDPVKEWTFDIENSFSKSQNSPFMGTVFKGLVTYVMNNKQVYITPIK